VQGERDLKQVPVRIQLFAPKEYSVGMTLRPTSGRARDSGSYRKGFVNLEVKVEAGEVYTLIPSTFEPGLKGPFFFKVVSTAKVHLAPAS